MRLRWPSRRQLKEWFSVSLRDTLVLLVIMLAAAGFCALSRRVFDSSDSWASMVFVLAVLFTAINTSGYLYGMLAALIGVIGVNYVFTYPYFAFNFTMQGYAFTFAGMLAVSIATSVLTTRLKRQEYLRAETEKEKMRANLLRAVSHDLRTPLTNIAGASGVLLEGGAQLSGEQQRELLRGVNQDAQWLIRVVENLLSVTRIGDAQAQITKEPEAAEEVLGGAVQKFRRRFPNITVTVSVPEEVLLVPMDPILIEQVLSNLLENAAVHGGTTTRIQLSLEREDCFARVCVRDNGQGIPQKELPGLFDETRKPTSASHGDGKRNMGLGLSVCRAIVGAHGGTMEAKNLEEGAEFSFRLPLYEEVYKDADPGKSLSN